MFQFPTDTLAKTMHEKKQMQSHILHLITLTITKLAPNYTINRTSCTEKPTNFTNILCTGTMRSRSANNLG